MASISGNPAFDRFCQGTEDTMEQLYDALRDHVSNLMRAAGEDAADKLLLAMRTNQFAYSLKAHADRQLTAATEAASRAAPRIAVPEDEEERGWGS
jgi:hypothetical protein